MSSTANKILIVSSEFPPNVGGIGNHAYNLANSLAGEGFDVTVMADIINLTQKELRQFEAEQTFKIKWITRRRFVIHSYLQRVFFALRLSVKAGKVICSGKFSLWMAILIKILIPAKECIAIVHGTELDLKSTIPKRLTAYSLSKFNKIIAVSSYTKKHLPKNLPATTKTYIIHNGINGREYAAVTPANLPGVPALVTVGNITERKGQENVIKALPNVLAAFSTAFYHVIGKPTDLKKVQTLTKELKVEQAVKFYGAVSRPELIKSLSGASIKLMLSNHTSSGDFEGFGIAILEANVFGIPAIGTRNSGIADAIEDKKTGILVDPTNTTEIVDAVNTIMSNYQYFSSNARRWATQHDWKNIVKEYIAVLNA